jgi:chlorobactene glucosyltransferase
VVTVHLLVSIYHVGVLSILAIVLVALIVNMGFIRLLRPGAVPKSGPLVSVLIPARNEAGRIGPCLSSLIDQDYSNIEILVLDDHSEDETAEIAKRFRDVRLFTGQPLPKGWTGKSWACHQLANAATGELVLFTDADTIHSHEAVSAAVREQQRTGADLLSLWPYQVNETMSERLVIPLLYVVGGSYVPHWLVSWCQAAQWPLHYLPKGWVGNLGVANGQFLLFRRESYDRIGGHEAVRDQIAEDIALARAIASQIGNGMRLINANAVLLVRCRMYQSLAEIWHGFTKNLRPVFARGNLGFLVAVGGQFLVFVLPFLLVIFSSSLASIAEVSLIYCIRVVAAIRYRGSWLSVLLHPIGYTLALAIALNSLRRTIGAGVTWKGRVYRPVNRSS